MEKTCLKCCETKPISEFYVFKSRKGSAPTSQCKACIRATVEKRRKIKELTDPDWAEKEAERHRKKQARYRALGLACEPTQKEKSDSIRRYRIKNPEKYAAHAEVAHALKIGLLKKKSCCKCGNQKTGAHHEDYSKPLDVVWLCDKHHKARHVEINDARRRAKVEAARAANPTLVLT